ncbi:MAG: hypothetical protein U1B83_04660 [Candidatus Cloacimonadaceae bacterium]|nr:hypothetical protein [Candidatus Cloacimonadaceae bacterium]
MRILICRPNRHLAGELIEYFRGCDWEADVAAEPGSIYQSLSRHKYDASLYYVSSLDDFAVIRYINDTYPEIQVVITSDSGFETSIENVRQGAFTSLKQPYHLSQLHELFAHETPLPAPNQGIGQ